MTERSTAIVLFTDLVGSTFNPVGNLELKGLPESVPTVEVGWEPLAQSSVPLPSFLTDIGRIFVGVWTTRRSVDHSASPKVPGKWWAAGWPRLSDDANQTLRIAAVVGPELELGVVRAAGELSEETLLARCRGGCHRVSGHRGLRQPRERDAVALLSGP